MKATHWVVWKGENAPICEGHRNYATSLGIMFGGKMRIVPRPKNMDIIECSLCHAKAERKARRG